MNAQPFTRAFVSVFLSLMVLASSRPVASAALPLQPEQVVVTCFSGLINYYSSPPTLTPNLGLNGYVVAQFDTTTGTIGPLIPPTTSPPELWDAGDVPPVSSFHNETGQRWNAQRLGEVFGICVDDAVAPNIYVTATECYNIVGSSTPLPKGAGGPGGIYKLDGNTGASTFGSLTNSANGPGLGNVCFRRAGNGTGYLYASNLEDGNIYRMDAATLTVVGTAFDHGVTGRGAASLAPIADLGTPGLTQFGRRIWGVQTFQNRLYYAVWWEDSRNISLSESNEIWSVALDNSGDFIGSTAQRHFALPNFNTNPWSHPAASIDFSPGGKMFLAERYWQYLGMVSGPTFGAHHTRILRYWLSGPNWVTDPSPTHHIGGDPGFYFTNNMVGANSAGGVAVNCDESVWGTGDMYAGSYSTPPNIPFGPGDLGYVYGCLRIPTGGNSMYAGYGYGSFAIDFDGNTNSVAKFGVGAIATVKDCCLPPPTGMVAWWPLDETTGAPTYADLSGSGNTALVESGGPLGNFGSPAPIPGKVAGAGSFLDSSTRGRAPNASSLNFGTNSFSLDCWVNPVQVLPTTWQTIVDKFDTNTQRGYTVGISNGTVVLRVGDGTAYTHIGPAINYGAWNFVGVVVNRTAGAVRFYVNGAGSGPQALTPTGSFSNAVDLLIGAPYAPNITSETALDEIELFNRTLTTNELNDLWVADALGKCKSGPPPCSNSVVSIVCPTNLTIACAPVVIYPPPQASTTCGTITNIICTPPSGSNFPVGPTVVTCTAYDSLGNSNSCSFTITVTPDVVPPVLNCQCLTNSFQEQLNVVGCTAVVPGLCFYSQCATDDCGIANCSQTPPAGTPVGPGVTPITVTVTDFAGNSNSCVVLMTVTAPPGGCGGPCDPVWNFLDLTMTSTNGIFTGANGSIKASTSGGPFLAMNNSAYGSQFPILFGASGIVTGYVAQAELGATYSVTFDLSAYAITPGTVFGIWNTTEETDTYQIEVFDCASNQIAPPFGAGTFSFLGWDDDALSGNIGWHHLTLNPTTGLLATAPFTTPDTDCDAAFWTNLPPNACRIVVTGTSIPDADGVVFYFAEPDPCCEITCPTNLTVFTCSNSVVVFYPDPVLTNCAPDVSLICNPPSGSSFPLGTNTVSCSVVDALGGVVAACDFKVIVAPPPGGCGDPCTNGWSFLNLAITSTNGIFTGANGSIQASTSGGPFMSLNNTAYGSQFTNLFPASGIVTGYLAQASLGATYSVTFDLSAYALTPGTVFGIWNTTEESGTYKIQVFDCASNPIAPPFGAGTFSFLGWDDDALSGNIGWYHLTLNAVSGFLTTTLFDTSGTDCDAAFWTNLPPNACRIVVTGNSIPDADGVVFYFAEPEPCCEITCPTNITVTTCGTNAVVVYPAPTPSNCGTEPIIICNPPSGSVFPIGTNTVTCSVMNAVGVVASCEFKVIVVQSTSLPPWTVSCPPFETSINVTGCPPVMPNLSSYITIVTNCTLACPPIVTQSIPPGTPLTAGNYVAIVNICDCLTNCAVCDISINAYATGGNPTITCPPNQTVITCGTNAVVKYKVQATGQTGVVTCNPPSGSTFPLGTTWVTCTATNACGGIATCQFSVTVRPPKTRWPCGWQVGIGIPFEPVGGATTALKAVGPGGPGYPAICVFPNPGNPNSGVLLHLEQAGLLTFTTELDFTAPVGAGIDLVLPPGPLNSNNTPLLSFRNKGPKGYCVKMNKRFADDPTGTFRSIAVNTNGHLLDSFTFNSDEALTNDTLVIGYQPGVTNCHVTVELNLVDGSMSVEFDGPVVPVTPTAARHKGWDGCIYGPDRPVKKPKATARVIVTPPVSPGQPPITELYLYASGIPEFGVEEPAIAAAAKPRRKWSDGHVTLIKLYDDEGSAEFAAPGSGGLVQVDVGHAESFDLRLVRLETNTIPGEELLTRTVGLLSGQTNNPPYLDALLLKENGGGVECSADFSNLGSPTVSVLIYSNSVLVAERVGVPGVIGQPLFTLSTWPDRLGKLGGATPCRRGKVPPSLIVLPPDGGGLPPVIVTGDEFRVLAEPLPGALQPDYYSAFQFLPSDGGDWAVEDLTTTSICVAEPVAILEANGNVTVTWAGNIFRLQGAEEVTGPWYDLGPASPITVPATSRARFFRLVCD